MEISINNLGAITKGKIEIKENKLNIKYGINGIGKSTLSKGIKGDNLSLLKKYGSDIDPIVQFDKKPSNVLMFNQDYVKEHLFKEDIVNNSFEIIINTKEYRDLDEKIKMLLNQLIDSINNSEEIDKTKNELEALLNMLVIKEKNTKKDGTKYTMPASQKFIKGKKIPKLESVLMDDALIYKEKLTAINNYDWLKWFLNGYGYVENNSCPFCLKPLHENFEEIYNNIKNSYEKTPLKTNVEVKKALNDTEKYMPKQEKTILTNAFISNEELSNDEKAHIYSIRKKCELELAKLKNLKSLNTYSIKENDDKDKLRIFLFNNKLDKDFYDICDEKLKQDINTINNNIDDVISKTTELSRLTKLFNENLNNIVKNKTEYVDRFLQLAGIPYVIEIQEYDNGKYKTVLKPKEEEINVKEDDLSYGEKNAIALILFSLEINENHDLIILDDPVSSFDENKKFALLYYLFSKDDAVLKDKTVLLLTHDFDIIVDFIFKLELSTLKPYICNLYNNDGELKEKVIKRKYIKETLGQWKKKSRQKDLNIMLRVVNLRKYLMYAYPEENDAIDILSSLEHNDIKPMKKKNGEKITLLEKEIENGINKIKDYNPTFSDFDFDIYRTKANNIEELKQCYSNSNNSIEKLQLLRIIIERSQYTVPNKVVWDYITQYYHVENNDMVTLVENKFDLVPPYIMAAADEIFSSLS